MHNVALSSSNSDLMIAFHNSSLKATNTRLMMTLEEESGDHHQSLRRDILQDKCVSIKDEKSKAKPKDERW